MYALIVLNGILSLHEGIIIFYCVQSFAARSRGFLSHLICNEYIILLVTSLDTHTCLDGEIVQFRNKPRFRIVNLLSAAIVLAG